VRGAPKGQRQEIQKSSSFQGNRAPSAYRQRMMIPFSREAQNFVVPTRKRKSNIAARGRCASTEPEGSNRPRGDDSGPQKIHSSSEGETSQRTLCWAKRGGGVSRGECASIGLGRIRAGQQHGLDHCAAFFYRQVSLGTGL